jgi:hypothetical protein
MWLEKYPLSGPLSPLPSFIATLKNLTIRIGNSGIFTSLALPQFESSHYYSNPCETLLCETLGKPMVLRLLFQ